MKRGFIFTLDALVTVYISLIGLMLVLSYIEVISQLNHDDLYLSSYSNDFYNLNYYSDTLINSLNLTDKYRLLASKDCENHKLFFGESMYYYLPVKYSGYPNVWFQVGYDNKRLISVADQTYCFKNY